MLKLYWTLFFLKMFVYISDCHQNITVRENTTVTLSCSVKLVNEDSVFWYNEKLSAAICQCIVSDKVIYCPCNDLYLIANYSDAPPTQSTLTIINTSIHDSGKWRCFSSSLNADIQTYNLLVVASAINANCETLFTENFSQLKLMCTAEHMYPSGNCQMFVNNTANTEIEYNHTVDNQGSFKSMCTSKVQLNTLHPGQLNLTLQLYPNYSNYSYGISVGRFVQLDYPDPILKDCPLGRNVIQSYIQYGSNASCMCSVATTGNPPGNIKWINTSSIDIHSTNVLQVNTTNIAGTYTCGVVNLFASTVEEKTIMYKPLLAYGPSHVELLITISNNGTTSICNLQPVVLILKCNSAEANPPNIRFTIMTNDSSETIETTLKEFSKRIEMTVPGQLDIICVASNIIFAALRAADSQQIFIQKPPESAPAILVNQQTVNNLIITVQEGEHIVISCKILGGVPNSGNISLFCGSNSIYTEGSEAHLPLGNISIEMHGQRCFCSVQHVTKCYDKNSQSAILNVLYQPKVVTFTAVSSTNQAVTGVTNASMVYFKCKADGNPEPRIMIESRGRQFLTDIDGSFNTLLTCIDGGVFYCNASNGIMVNPIEKPKITVNVLCNFHLQDLETNETAYFMKKATKFSRTLNIIGYPAPQYFIIEKRNVTTMNYDVVKLTHLPESQSFVSLDHRVSLSFAYVDAPFGELKIHISVVDFEDFTQYIIHISNNVTVDELKLFLEIKQDNTSSEDEILIAAIIGSLCVVILITVVIFIIFKRKFCLRKIRNIFTKEHSTTATETVQYVNRDRTSNPVTGDETVNTEYEDVDIIPSPYDNMDRMQTEEFKSNYLEINNIHVYDQLESFQNNNEPTYESISKSENGSYQNVTASSI